MSERAITAGVASGTTRLIAVGLTVAGWGAAVLDRWWIWTVTLTGWAATEAFRSRGQAST